MNEVLKTGYSAIFIFLLLIVSRISYSSENDEYQSFSATDSLSLKAIISEIIRSHPTVKSAEEALNNADARIGLAKTGNYPFIDFSANLSNLGPVTTISIPDMGTFKLFPENNYSAGINYRQVVYDFGRTRQSIALETQNKAIDETALEQTKQKISAIAVSNFYTLAFLQDAIKIKDEQLVTLNEHLKYVETLKSTGSANEFQVLSTKVKISTVESQKVDLTAALTMQQSFLNSLLGLSDKNIPLVKKELLVELPVIPGDSLFSFAFKNRDEVIMNNEKVSQAQIRYELTKSYKKPVLSLMGTGGAKNGYLPDLNAVRANYVVGAGFLVPIFDAQKTKFNLRQVESSIISLNYQNETTKRNITSEVVEAKVYMKAALQKVNEFELQLQQALKAYTLAEVSFRAGTISNLDLLDTNTSVSESRLLLLKARIDYAASIYRLKAALGERLY
jgi:outer membrane protein